MGAIKDEGGTSVRFVATCKETTEKQGTHLSITEFRRVDPQIGALQLILHSLHTGYFY